MIRIAQASSSEDYTKYGVAPNQRRTGVTASNPGGNMDGELNVVPWYGPWEKVYRPVDNVIAERVATFMERAVANGSHIGYSWSGNTGVFDALRAIGSTDPADIKMLVNCDCATLVGAAIYYAGIHESKLRALVTWKMDEILESTHAFTVLTDKELCEKGTGVQRGDLVWKTGHVACVLDSDTSGLKELMVFQRFTFSASISSGTPGTRAEQLLRAISKPGYRPIVARLASVSNSALANVVPFLGGGNENKLYVNYYRASGNSGKIDATVMVVWVRNEVTV